MWAEQREQGRVKHSGMNNGGSPLVGFGLEVPEEEAMCLEPRESWPKDEGNHASTVRLRAVTTRPCWAKEVGQEYLFLSLSRLLLVPPFGLAKPKVWYHSPPGRSHCPSNKIYKNKYYLKVCRNKLVSTFPTSLTPIHSFGSPSSSHIWLSCCFWKRPNCLLSRCLLCTSCFLCLEYNSPRI